MASFSKTLYELLKSKKVRDKRVANYILGEANAAGLSIDKKAPISSKELDRVKNIVYDENDFLLDKSNKQLEEEATKFLKKSGYNEQGDFDVGEIGDDVLHNEEDFKQALYDKFYQDLIKNQETTPLYLEDEFASNKLLKSLIMREKLLQYTKTKDPQIYQELAAALHEYPTRNVEQRYKQVSNWLKRADDKYKEIVNPSGPKRQLSYANRRYTNMDDPIQGDTFNEDFDMFDLEDYIQRENITNPHLKSYLEAELHKLNPKDAYDAEIIRQLEQKL